MSLGQVINKYIYDHRMSKRSFSIATGLSPSYVAYLIKGETTTGSSASPTIDTYRVCAKAMGMDVDELVRLSDDSAVIDGNGYSEATKILLNALRGASEDEIMQAAKIVMALRQK